MNDHFWPSMYPGLIVGLLFGLAAGGLLSMIAGALGGLAGAAAMYFLVAWLGLQDSIVSLAALICGAAAGGYFGAPAGMRLAQALAKKGNRSEQ
jgi:hypothetical protein